MKVEFSAEQNALRKELRAYFEALMTPELKAECDENMGEGGGPLWREALKAVNPKAAESIAEHVKMRMRAETSVVRLDARPWMCALSPIYAAV